MKYLIALAISVSLAANAAAPLPNEAVGRLSVDLPPGPANPNARNTHLTRESWTGGLVLPAYVIATGTGPQECFQPWIDSACRPYKPGTDKRQRAWVVKRGGQWLKCPMPDSAEGCVGYSSYPVTRVQD